MSSNFILICVIVYSVLLFAVTWFTSRGADNESFFVGNRSSKWYLVAYGMIGASLSGVTFISVPGAFAGDIRLFIRLYGYCIYVVTLILPP